MVNETRTACNNSRAGRSGAAWIERAQHRML